MMEFIHPGPQSRRREETRGLRIRVGRDKSEVAKEAEPQARIASSPRIWSGFTADHTKGAGSSGAFFK